MPASEPRADTAPAGAAPQTLTVVWVYNGPVCVSGMDPPAPVSHDGVCHCPACHGAFRDDWDQPFD